jgi:hypothetical protein
LRIQNNNLEFRFKVSSQILSKNLNKKSELYWQISNKNKNTENPNVKI